MDTELTGRKVKVTKELRNLADEGLTRIEKFVGRGASAHVIFSSQKHAATAEVTVNARQHRVVGQAEAPELKMALRMALEKAERQAIRHKKSRIEKTRQGTPISTILPEQPVDPSPVTRTRERKKKAPATNGKIAGAHVIPAPESMAARPMTIDEAVKEAESCDQQVFVFRDMVGDVKVLHCAGDGIVRLIEVS